MVFLTDAEKLTLAERIRLAEAGTRGEIITVIAHRSDDYQYIPLLWAALFALCVPGLHYLFQSLSLDSWRVADEQLARHQWLYLLQALVFVTLATLFQWAPVQRLLIPRSVQRQRAHRQAQSQFMVQRVHWTPHRAGILVFVSVAERYVEIIVDQGVADVVDDSHWQQSISHFVNEVRAGRIAAGFEATIEDCREVLWQHFPGGDNDGDSLTNHLIEIGEP